MNTIRKIMAALLAIVTFAIAGKAVSFLLNIGGTFAIAGVTDSQRAFDNVAAAANILGLVAGLYLASRVYRWLAGKPISAPAEA